MEYPESQPVVKDNQLEHHGEKEKCKSWDGCQSLVIQGPDSGEKKKTAVQLHKLDTQGENLSIIWECFGL